MTYLFRPELFQSSFGAGKTTMSGLRAVCAVLELKCRDGDLSERAVVEKRARAQPAAWEGNPLNVKCLRKPARLEK